MRRDRSKRAVSNARAQRKRMGSAEKRLWTLLRRGALGFRFRRQYPVGGFILDFYCPETRVAVEVDGDFHDRERDALRDARLAELGILTVRIWTSALYPSAIPAADLVWRHCAERQDGDAQPPP